MSMAEVLASRKGLSAVGKILLAHVAKQATRHTIDL